MIDLFANSYVAVALLILGFGFLIFIHELGHFAVAKWVGIRATQFAIGFGNAMLSYRKGLGFRIGGTEKEYLSRATEALRRDGVLLEGLSEHQRSQRLMEAADRLGLGETEYRLNTLPLGGYVKMLGQEDLDPAAQSDDPRAFNRKPIWARAAVISAGVVMNLIFGLLFFILAFRIGVEFPAAVVGGVVPGSPAATTYAQGHDSDPAFRGLVPGDTIIRIGDDPISDMTEVRVQTALARGGKTVPITVQREGREQPLTFPIVPAASAATEGLLSAGIFPAFTLTVAESGTRPGEAATAEGSPFRAAGLTSGMELFQVNGQPVANIGQFERLVRGLDDPQLTLTFRDPKSPEQTVEVVTQANPSLSIGAGDDADNHLLGLSAAVQVTPQEGSPAAAAGVQAGDVLAQVGAAQFPNVAEVMATVAQAGGPLPVRVLREGQTVDLGEIKPSKGKIGVALEPAPLVISRVAADSPFARAAADRPLPAGSRLLQVDGQAVESWSDFQRLVQQSVRAADDGRPVTLDLQLSINLAGNPQENYEVVLEPAEVAALQQELAWLPPSGVMFEPLLVKVQADSPWAATTIGVQKTGQFIQQTYITLVRLIQGTIGVPNLRGPVGIVDEGAKISAQGLPYFLFFLGLISINLAVLNFLPMPIVDGGLMVFLLIEKIKGSPVSPQVQTAVSLVGLLGLACVFVVVTYHDIARLIMG